MPSFLIDADAPTSRAQVRNVLIGSLDDSYYLIHDDFRAWRDEMGWEDWMQDFCDIKEGEDIDDHEPTERELRLIDEFLADVFTAAKARAVR